MLGVRFMRSIALFFFFFAAGAIFGAVAPFQAFQPFVLGADPFQREQKAENLYDRAVHDFFDQEYEAVKLLLEKVEEMGSVDPRPYYFLGLAHLRTNNAEKAKSYFEKAAGLEWEERGAREYNVSEALRRIQGAERGVIENSRAAAKVRWQNKEFKRREAVYGETKDREKAVLREIRRQASDSADLKSFIGTAPFGARSADPFHKSMEGDPVGVFGGKKTEPPETTGAFDRVQTTETSKPNPPAAKPLPRKPVQVDEDDPFN